MGVSGSVCGLGAGGGAHRASGCAPAWRACRPWCAALLGLMVTAGQPWLTQAQGQGNSAQPSNPFADVHGWDRAGARAN